MGISRSETNRDTVRVEIMDTPMCLAKSLTRKSEEKINGINTAMVVAVAATMARHTSPVPRITDSAGLYAQTPEPVNIFKHNHGGIQKHPHSQCDTDKRQAVDGYIEAVKRN